MAFQPFYYSPSPSPVSTPCRMSFLPRPRLASKPYNVTDYPFQPNAVFADAVSIPFTGTLILSPTKKERKEAEARAQRLQVEEELKANGGKPDLAEKERIAITELCRALNVEMKEITPDGHCLYSAVADQLNLQTKGSKLNFHDTRKATASFMRSHADDFMPFISDSDEHMAGIDNKEAGSQKLSDAEKQQEHFLKYCDAVESTGVWGGQPEILALSRAFETPIHVVQAGSPVVKVGNEEYKGEPLMISYHRRMYGLGEHYNSLHKLSK